MGVSDRGHLAGERTAGLPYLPALDGLRALAIVGVVLFHGNVPGIQGGFLGVDLFFALSGWLITSLLLRGASRDGSVRLGAFWGRRMRRLLPAALTMIVAVTVWWSLFGTPAERWAVLSDAPWAQFYVANWHEIATSSGYWTSFDAPAPLDHLWSLAIEEQFYVVWPLVVFLVARFARRRGTIVLALSLLGVGASFATSWLLVDVASPTRAYMGTDARASSLLLGAAMATPTVRRGVARLARSIGTRAFQLLTGAVAVAMVAMWFVVGSDGASWLFRGGLLAHSALAALLVVLIATTPAAAVSGPLRHRAIVWLGRRSYGLYLWHWPVFVWLDAARVGIDGAGLFAFRLLVSLVLAELSYELVEDPIRRRVVWARGRRGAISVVGTMASVALLVAVVPSPPAAAAPPPEALGELVTGAATTTTTSPPEPSVTAWHPAPATAPTAPPPTIAAPPGTLAAGTAPTEPPVSAAAPPSAPPSTTAPAPQPVISSVVWMGDSVADDLGPGVVAAVNAAGLTVVSAAVPGASLTGGLWLEDGRTWLDDELPSKLTANPADVVVWQLSKWDAQATIEQNVDVHRRFVELALQTHRFVVFVTIPPLADSTDDAARRAVGAAARQVAAERPTEVLVLDADALWGPTFVATDESGVPLRKPDGIHVCPLGAARFAGFVVGELDAHFDGVSPADPATWVTAEWWTDSRYQRPAGICAV